MGEDTDTVINFTLSKDIHYPVTLSILELTGLSSSILLTHLNDKTIPSTSPVNDYQSTIDALIVYKLHSQIPPLIIDIHVESGVGKRLTTPYSYLLSGSICEEVSDILDDKLYSYLPEDGHVRLPIEYAEIPVNSTIVISLSCWSSRGRRVTIGYGRLELFEECILKSGKTSIPIFWEESEYKKNQKIVNEVKKDRIATENVNDKRPTWLINMTNEKHKNQINRTPELVIQLPQNQIPIVYSDVKYATMIMPVLEHEGAFEPSFNEITYINKKLKNMNITFDPDVVRAEHIEDPVEQKFRRLERNQHLSPLDKDTKPTFKMRSILHNIMMKQFFEKPTAKERNIVWRYRWFLLNSLVLGNNSGWSNFVINFIKCVDWNKTSEVKEFESILKTLSATATRKLGWKVNRNDYWWVFEQELEIVDCLELLSASHKHKIVREMAIKRLELVSDDELAMFMVQLVQNIRHETFPDEENIATADQETVNVGGSMDDEIIDIDGRSSSFNGSTYTIGSSEYQFVNKEAGSPNNSVDVVDEILNKIKNLKAIKVPILPSPLIEFLISRCAKNPKLTNFFYWCLKVEVEQEEINNREFLRTLDTHYDQNYQNELHRTIYEITMRKFIIKLATSSKGEEKLYELKRQIEFVSKLHNLCIKIKIDYKKETTQKKIEILKEMITEKHKRALFGGKLDGKLNINGDDRKNDSLVEFQPLEIPIDPSVIINGSFPEESLVFKSSLSPLKITFRTTDNKKYSVMYKIGDDLRQDQFVIQLITLMEHILESENMDLKLKPYKILATGPIEGFIQFLPNSSLSSILAKYNNSILAYLRAFNADNDAPLGVDPQVMDNYVRSCAGYCVVTYILGVGDRHLENLLLSKDGYFFHADYGYILGQDPKPFPPLMKLPIQVIDGMGGMENENYKKFCQYCFITYITLRKNASLILNLVQLMINTSIPALKTTIENSESEKQELLWKVQEKFMLDMNDEEAVLHFQNLIDDSVNAVLPVVIDRLHNLAQYWRA